MKTSHYYQVGFLGQANGHDVTIRNFIKAHFDELEISCDNIIFFNEEEIETHDRKFPLSVVFFGYAGADGSKHPVLKALMDDAVFILPVVDDLENFF